MMNERKTKSLRTSIYDGILTMAFVQDYMERFRIRDRRIILPLMDVQRLFYRLNEEFFDNKILGDITTKEVNDYVKKFINKEGGWGGENQCN